MNSKKSKNLSQAFTILKGELQLNFPIWLIQIIITGSVMLFLLIIGLAVNATANNGDFISYMFSDTDKPGSNIFLSGSVGFLLFTASIFSIIYTAKSLSYLYNKRKLDMYGSMPISRRCFFNSKVFSSFVMSVMVFIPFAALSVLIGLLMGANFENNEIECFVLFIFSVFFYIALYALCAVCSKSTLNALISLFIIESFLPLTTKLIKYFFQGFFPGINPFLMPDKFISNIFSLVPDGNSELVYIVIWLVLSALFLLICNLFIKKRNAENTRRMFVMPLLEYAIKIVLTLVAGLFIGLIVGALTINSGFVGFIIGFIVASVPTYIVIHIIYNRGFTNLLKSSVVLVVLIAVSIGFFWLCDANPMNFNNVVPNKEDIASAGIIDLQATPVIDINAETVLNSTSDFTDEEYINKIVTIHEETANMQPAYETWAKCRSSLMNMLDGTLSDAFANGYYANGFIITYKFKNGFVNSYYYPNEYLQYGEDYNFYTDYVNTLYANDTIADTLAEIEISEQYREKYRPLFTNPDMIEGFEICYDVYGYEGSYSEYKDYPTDYKSKEFYANFKKLSEAFKEDLKNDKNASENNKPFLPSIEDDYYDYYDDSDSFYFDADYDVAYAELSYTTANNQIQNLSNTSDKNEKKSDYPLIVKFGFELDWSYIEDMYYIPESYTNTINALKEIGALKADLSINIDDYEYYD